MTDDEILALQMFEKSDRFSDLEKAVLRYAEAMTDTPVTVTDEQFDRLEEDLSEKQMVELTAAIALENFSARFNHAFGIDSQDLNKKDS